MSTGCGVGVGFRGGNFGMPEDNTEVSWVSGISDGTVGISVSEGSVEVSGSVGVMG